ncbi:MAG: FAD-binding oxidoreductase [Verrucomicrobiaceae bacterium]|nr:FAD-binding oxidoreductase [Verrucomicrobiaceae bacterium]
MKIDTLIVGQGLAGSVLAWHLLEKGQRLLVVDRDEPNTSSKVAAGLVTPLAGARFALSESLETRLDYARAFYWKHEESCGRTFFHHRRIARLFQSEKERSAWTTRLENEGERYARFHAPLEIDPLRFHVPFGGFEMKEGGWLDVPAFLEYTRQALLERAAYAIARVESTDIAVEHGGVRWKNIDAARVVFCEGWRGNRNRFFDWVPMNAALGDILDLAIPALEDERRIVNRGGWLLPLGNGRFRVGSNYRHQFDSESPDETGEAEVLAKLAGITPAPFQVLRHRAAVRPVIRRSQVFLGVHPAHRRVAFFNGLGSKGVLNAPWYAAQLTEHLLRDVPLPRGSDLSHNHF